MGSGTVILGTFSWNQRLDGSWKPSRFKWNFHFQDGGLGRLPFPRVGLDFLLLSQLGLLNHLVTLREMVFPEPFFPGTKVWEWGSLGKLFRVNWDLPIPGMVILGTGFHFFPRVRFGDLPLLFPKLWDFFKPTQILGFPHIGFSWTLFPGTKVLDWVL